MYSKWFFIILLPVSLSAGWFWQNPQPQGNPLWNTPFFNNNTGYAVGSAGTILPTTDSGQSWEMQESGTTIFLFDESGNDVPGGVYFYRLETGGLSYVNKIVKLR